MSALTPERVCNSYKWLLHIGQDTLPGTTLYNGIGSATPFNILNSTVVSTSAFLPGNITSSQPFKIKVAGALSATSLVFMASGADINNYLNRITSNNNSLMPLTNDQVIDLSNVNTNISNNFFVHTTPNTQFVALSVMRGNFAVGIGVNNAICWCGNNMFNTLPQIASTNTRDNRNSFVQCIGSRESFQYTPITSPVALSGSFDGSSALRSFNSTCANDSVNATMASADCKTTFTFNAIRATPPQSENSTHIRFTSTTQLGCMANSTRIANDNSTAFTDDVHRNSTYVVTGNFTTRNLTNSMLLHNQCANALNSTNSFQTIGGSTTPMRNVFQLDCDYGLSSANLAALRPSALSLVTKASSTEPRGVINCWTYNGSNTLNASLTNSVCWKNCFNNTFSTNGTVSANNAAAVACDHSSLFTKVYEGATNSFVGVPACTLCAEICAPNASYIQGYGNISCGRNSFAIHGCNRINAVNSAIIGHNTGCCSLSANSLYVNGNQFFLIGNMPTSPTGLPCGHVWRDPATNNLRIVLS